jgi:hypothetical protein
MNQQRSRRFRSAQEAKEADEKKAEFAQLLRRQNNGGKSLTVEEDVIQKTWDSNVITPGTPFMDILAAALRYWVAYKLNTDPAWEKVSLSVGAILLYFFLLTVPSSKSLSLMPLYLEKESTRSWSLFDHKDRAQSMIRIPDM